MSLFLIACSPPVQGPTSQHAALKEGEGGEGGDSGEPGYAGVEGACRAVTSQDCVDASYEVKEADGVATRAKSCTECRGGYATCCEWLRINGVWVQNCTPHTCSCFKFGTIAWCDYTQEVLRGDTDTNPDDKDLAELGQACVDESKSECVTSVYDADPKEDGYAFRSRSCSTCSNFSAICCEWIRIDGEWEPVCASVKCDCWSIWGWFDLCLPTTIFN